MAQEYTTTDVVKFFRRKTNEGFDSVTYLGAEQRFISALQNSNVNNLEEQYILGTDTITEYYTDENGNQITEKSFRKDDSDVYYYKVKTIVYSDENIYHFDNNSDIIPSDYDVIKLDELYYIDSTNPQIEPLKVLEKYTGFKLSDNDTRKHYIEKVVQVYERNNN